MTGQGLDVAVQYAVDRANLPDEAFIAACARQALGELAGELAIRVVDVAESAALNQRYLGKSGPTNVLAFPAGDTAVPADEPAPIGDIVICADVLEREAREQGKSLQAHWAHILVHGCLHLAGYDHIAEVDACRMEAREKALLAGLGIADPYGD